MGNNPFFSIGLCNKINTLSLTLKVKIHKTIKFKLIIQLKIKLWTLSALKNNKENFIFFSKPIYLEIKISVLPFKESEELDQIWQLFNYWKRKILIIYLR